MGKHFEICTNIQKKKKKKRKNKVYLLERIISLVGLVGLVGLVFFILWYSFNSVNENGVNEMYNLEYVIPKHESYVQICPDRMGWEKPPICETEPGFPNHAYMLNFLIRVYMVILELIITPIIFLSDCL